MIIDFTNYYDQTQNLGLGVVLSYSGEAVAAVATAYPLFIALSKSVEYGMILSESTEYGIISSDSVEFGISLAKTGGGNA